MIDSSILNEPQLARTYLVATNISFQKLDWAEKILSFAEHNQAANIKIEVRIPPRIDQQLKQSSSESSITVPIEVR